MMKRNLTLLFLSIVFTTGAWALEQDGEGCYLLGTVQDWKDFAALVQTTPTANAKMTADINLGDDQTMVGTEEHPYQGTFDGQGYTITYDLVSTDECCGLFAHLNGTVRNLYVDGTMQVNHDYAGSIAGKVNFPALIEQCHSKVKITANGGDYIGGLVGLSTGCYTPPYVRIQNCIYSGHINGFSLHRSGILGWADMGSNCSRTQITNCLVTAQIDDDVTGGTGHIIADGGYWGVNDETTVASIGNCYYVYPYGSSTPYGATQVTMEQVESGEVCCLLNVAKYIYDAVEYQTIFRQNIGEDKFPVFDPLHGLVKEITSMGYASFAPGYFGLGNTSDNVIVPQGVEAYTGTLNGNSLLLHPAGNVIGGGNGNGFVLKGKPGFYSFVPTNEERTTIDNELDGGNQIMDTRYATYYVLGEKDGVVGFYKYNVSDKVGMDSHVAFLLNPPTDVDMLTLSFEEGTSIQEIQHVQQVKDTSIYDLNGRHVKNATNGVNIVNGRKVLRSIK